MSNLRAGPLLAYTFDEWCQAVGISRSEGYKRIAAGEIETYKDGRRRMVSAKAGAAYVDRKERASQGKAA